MDKKEYKGEDLAKLTREINSELNKMFVKELVEFRGDWLKELVHINVNTALTRVCLDLVDRVIRRKEEE